MTPAEGYQEMVNDLAEKTKVEGQLAAISRIAAGIQTAQMTKEERESFDFMKESLSEVVQSVQQRHRARVLEVVKAEQRALTRKCQVGAMQPHYWLDTPGRKANVMPAAAERYAFAISCICPAHDRRIT